MRFQKIINFHCPRWDELPSEPLFNRDLVAYVNRILNNILFDNDYLTQTMVQNYSKWGVIPKIHGRKYERQHVAYLIIITIYKQVLSLDDLKEGLRLQLNLMTLEEAYDSFAYILEQALKTVFQGVFTQAPLAIDSQIIIKDAEGVSLIANTYAQKLLGSMIIQSGGYQKMKENVNE